MAGVGLQSLVTKILVGLQGKNGKNGKNGKISSSQSEGADEELQATGKFVKVNTFYSAIPTTGFHLDC